MKKNKNYIVLFFLLIIFILIFKYNNLVKSSVISASILWFNNLLPFLLPTYIIVDLLINYGLVKIFKKKYLFLILISFILGAPSNAKYINEFYIKGYIDKCTANWLLLFCYSPNPLFIIGIVPSLKIGLIILLYNYVINLLIGVMSFRFFNITGINTIIHEEKTFSKCLEDSINKSFKTLIMILGIVCIYSVLNSLLEVTFLKDNLFLNSILELTNALNIIKLKNSQVLSWMLFAVSFSGLSIHTQIKSILEDTDISYKYFLFGRCIASIIPLILIIFN